MNKKDAIFQYTLVSFERDFGVFADAFKDFCAKHGISDSVTFDMEVSLEELIVNSFSYGNSKGPVVIKAEILNDEVKIVLEDEAPPFNLLREAPPLQEGNIEDRRPGGLGIHLVKSLNDRMEYQGSRKGNTITLFKSIGSM